MTSTSASATLARELSLPPASVAATIALLDDGATVPFVARYRKERTGGLDEVQIRAIEERRRRLAELDARRTTILDAIEAQGKLDARLREALFACTTKTALEDLYAPYKKKRKTRASMARDRGLEPLAERIAAQPSDGDPGREARAFVDPARDVPDVKAALAGARDIVAERVADDPDARRAVRETYLTHGRLASKAARGKKKVRSKFERYHDFSERIARVPSHRVLAILRGESEGLLRWSVDVDEDRLRARLHGIAGVRRSSPFSRQLREAVDDAYPRLLRPSLTNDVRAHLEERAGREAVEVFAGNLEDLLLAAPLGAVPVIGVDPGLRTGCKCAALDATGRLREHTTIFPDRGGGRAAERTLRALVDAHRPAAVAVGNGTGGREMEAFARRVLDGTETVVVSVNEAGASIYSASDLAREELPDVDLTVRGAVSIGRRLQDPLAELVKLDPKTIGVGQYQHDVDQGLLARKLAEVVESCVNRVGVELNTASPSLLTHVAGIGPSLAARIVAHREARGPFASRRALLEVRGLGPKAFEQAAGFLRVAGGAHPLDASAVHPERYALVERMAKDLGVPLEALVGDGALAARIDVARYRGFGGDDELGEPTLRDVVAELAKPGRDPRERFEAPRFRDDVREIEDLREGMELEGVVTNVTHFGAFVDLGVHEDGLIHVSQLADHFVHDPRDEVKVGDRVGVRVLSVDLDRRRIGLSRRRGAAKGGQR